jgi:hypothetical protein
LFRELDQVRSGLLLEGQIGQGKPHGGKIESKLLIIRLELQRGREFRLGQGRIFVGYRDRASQLMILNISPGLRLDGGEDPARKVELAKSHRCSCERHFIGRHTWFERYDPFAPRERLTATSELRCICHDARGREAVWVALQELPGHEHRALIVAAREEGLRLFCQMGFTPDPVSTIASESESTQENAGRQASTPTPIELAPLDGPDVPETVVICGILHCVQE